MRGHNLPVAEPAVRMLQKQITIGKELKIMNREQLFCRIQQLGFTVDDIVLYLDTHPNCQKALAYYQRQRDLLREAREEYNRKYGPLTVVTFRQMQILGRGCSSRGRGKGRIDLCGVMTENCSIR